MIKKYMIFLFCFILLGLGGIIYKYNKTYYISPDFYKIDMITDISRIEVTTNVLENVNGEIHTSKTSNVKYKLIEDKDSIDEIIDLLCSIPLNYVSRGEDFNDENGGIILFYDNDGLNVGNISFNENGYIYDSRDVTIYRPKDVMMNIIDRLNELSFE